MASFSLSREPAESSSICGLNTDSTPKTRKTLPQQLISQTLDPIQKQFRTKDCAFILQRFLFLFFLTAFWVFVSYHAETLSKAVSRRILSQRTGHTCARSGGILSCFILSVIPDVRAHTTLETDMVKSNIQENLIL